MTHPEHNPPAAAYVAEQSKEPESALDDIWAVASKHGYLIVALAALLVGSLLGFTVGKNHGTPFELRQSAQQKEDDLRAELSEQIHGSGGVAK